MNDVEVPLSLNVYENWLKFLFKLRFAENLEVSEATEKYFPNLAGFKY